jgi:hypothetical protein
VGVQARRNDASSSSSAGTPTYATSPSYPRRRTPRHGARCSIGPSGARYADSASAMTVGEWARGFRKRWVSLVPRFYCFPGTSPRHLIQLASFFAVFIFSLAVAAGQTAPVSPSGQNSTVGSAPSSGANTPPAAPSQRRVSFKGKSGRTSLLDWAGDSVSYRGDLSADEGAPAFFQSFVGTKYACQGGRLVPKDPNTPAPKLIFRFQGAEGRVAVVDLSGAEPQYSGALPVDASAKPFFTLVLKLAHCVQP